MSNRFEDQFLDYLEGTLDAHSRAEFESALAKDTELRAALDDYRRVIQLESNIAQSQREPHPSFSVKVMQSIGNAEPAGASGFMSRLFMIWEENRRLVIGSLATFATLVVVMRLSYDVSVQSAKMDTERSVKAIAALEATESKDERKVSKAEPVVPQANGLGKIEEALGLKEKSGEEGRLNDVQAARAPAPVIAQGVLRSDEERFKDSDTIAADPNKVFQEVQQQRFEPAERGANGSQPAGLFKKNLEQGISAKLGVARERDFASSAGASITVDDLSARKTEMPAKRIQSGVVPDRSLVAVPPPAPPAVRVAPMSSALALHESYDSVMENSRMQVATNPVSTFSIDVDTASYANVRRFIRSGQLPPIDAVRIEELINYFDYSYPSQHERPFTLSYELAPSPLDKERYLLKLGIKARDAATERKPRNLVFLIDVSGSMADPNKLSLLKKALPVLVDSLGPEDRIAIVTYAGEAGVALESTRGSEKFRIINAIENLSASGNTNGGGGIRLAYDIARGNRIEGGVNRVILATDGDFNVGVTSTQELVRMIEDERRRGITLTTLGVGQGNLKDDNLEQLADKGNGNYFYLDSFNEARKVLQTDIAGTVDVVAKDVKLNVEFNPEHVVEYRLLGYDNRRLRRQDFHNDAVDAGEIGSGHTVTALYELVLTNTEAAKRLEQELRYQKEPADKTVAKAEERKAEVAFLKIRFKEPDADRSQLIEYPIMASDMRKDVMQTTDDFRFAAAVAYFGHILRRSQYVGTYTLQDVVTLAQAARGNDTKGYRQEFIELVKDAQLLLRQSATPSAG